MKELKKLTTFQDKAARGAKPKGFSEAWAVMVSRHMPAGCTFTALHISTYNANDLYR